MTPISFFWEAPLCDLMEINRILIEESEKRREADG